MTTQSKLPGQGAKSLPEMFWFSRTVKRNLAEYPGIRRSSIAIWNSFSPEEAAIIDHAYGEDNGIKMTHKTLMNLSHSEPRLDKVGGYGHRAMWVWQELQPMPKVVHTTTTPPPKARVIGVIEPDEEERRHDIKEAIKRAMVPIVPEPDPPAKQEPHIGDKHTFTCVGRLTDGIWMWRDDETGLLGEVRFDAL